MTTPSTRVGDTIALHARSGHFAFAGGFRHATPGRGRFHSHEGFEIVYHSTGAGVTYVQRRSRHAFAPGSIHVYSPGAVHDQTMTEPGQDWCVVVSSRVPFKAKLPVCFQIDAPQNEIVLADLAFLSRPRAGVSEAETVAMNLRAAALLVMLTGAAEVRRPVALSLGDRYAEQALALVQEQYRTLGLLADVAGQMGISTDHLRHVFKQRYGFGLMQMLIRTRIEAAKSLLEHSNLTLAAIADQCGFANERYLCTSFRRLTGLSPGRYRTRQRRQ